MANPWYTVATRSIPWFIPVLPCLSLFYRVLPCLAPIEYTRGAVVGVCTSVCTSVLFGQKRGKPSLILIYFTVFGRLGSLASLVQLWYIGHMGAPVGYPWLYPSVRVPPLYITVPDHLPHTKYTSNRVVHCAHLQGRTDRQGWIISDWQIGQQ